MRSLMPVRCAMMLAVHLLVEVLAVIDCLNLRIFQRRRAAVLQLLRVLLPGEVPGGLDTGNRAINSDIVPQ